MELKTFTAYLSFLAECKDDHGAKMVREGILHYLGEKALESLPGDYREYHRLAKLRREIQIQGDLAKFFGEMK